MRDDMPQPQSRPPIEPYYRERTTWRDRLIVLVGCAASALVTGAGVVWFTSQFVCK